MTATAAMISHYDKFIFDMKVTIDCVKKYDRLFQICAPDLSAFNVVILDKEEELGKTDRGEGGFGSTGK